ncbi:SNF2 family N-terminal domain-containing protein [Usnea florida]
MAFQSSPWVETNGGDPGRSKRLCIGLGNGPRSTTQIHWPGNYNFPEEPFDVSLSNSQILDDQAWSASAIEFHDVSQQHVGGVGGAPDQSLFQSHQNLLWPSSDQNPQPSCLEVVESTYKVHDWASDARVQRHPTSNAYDSWDPPSSVINPQPEPTFFNVLYGGDLHDEHHQDNPATISEHGCEDPVADGICDGRNNVDIGHEHTSYEVCLGLISTATLRVSNATLESIPANCSNVKLEIQGSVTTVHSVYKRNSSDYMGLLDHETASALGQIRQRHDFHIKAYILHDRKSDSKSSGTTWGASIPIYMVMYCHPEDSELIGEALYDNHIFLQHPEYIEVGTLYQNPQYFIRPGEDYPSVECMGDGPVNSRTESSNECGTLKETGLDGIFESARGPETYSIIEPSPRLSTTLQPHQQMGLAMMHEKESGNLQTNKFTTLWIQKSTSNGRTWYENSVTGSRKENPMLCLGGLLADEMGLGKSLTLIALIASTLDTIATRTTEEGSRSPLSETEKFNNTTLIVTPKSTLHSWKEQFDKHVRFKRIQVCYYSGNKRKSAMPALLSHDVVVTTYGMLTAEKNRRAKQSCDEDQPLLANHWLRVVLDEAHVIRNASTKQCATCCDLKARHRWCLTGTPIQNRVEDFGSLLQFLQVYPFNNVASFTHEIADWIRCGDEKGMNRLRLLVSAICLRRTKDCLGLPPRLNEIQPVVFNSEEKVLYETCKQSTVEFIELVLKEDGKPKSFATVIQLILRLRQICNHGKEMLSTKTMKNIGDFMLSQGSKEEVSTPEEISLCGICGRRTPDNDSFLPCLHPACSSCFEEKELIISKGELECSSCAGTSSPRSNNSPVVDQPLSDAMIVDYKPSSKVAALLKNLRSYNEDSTEMPIKSVVFSYWTKMLDLISKALHNDNIRFERLDGKMSNPQRHKAIQHFRSDPKCTVFLATVGSAGVGRVSSYKLWLLWNSLLTPSSIDLTAACRIHLMEPQWNPMAEEQALDRVHRIGQTQPVIATRYIVNESVEEYVVSLQKKKLDLIQQSLEPNAAPKTKFARFSDLVFYHYRRLVGRTAVKLCALERHRDVGRFAERKDPIMPDALLVSHLQWQNHSKKHI